MTTGSAADSKLSKYLNLILFFLFLYLFLLSIQLMGSAFKDFGAEFAQKIMTTTSSPLLGLFIGILSTSITQSSSLTTSMLVSFVAGGTMTLHNAIPIVMGANIGTTVTNTLVSLGHITRKEEFRRAFSCSLLHDNFNLLSVLIIFPLNYYTNFLEKVSLFLTEIFQTAGGFEFASPLKIITGPPAAAVNDLLGHHGWIVLLLALILLFASLRNMVVYMKRLIMARAEVIFERTVFRTALRGMLFGMILTSLVQSSSVTTSLMVPLAGAGLVTLEQVFPFTLGANVGTTVTAIMAALATGIPSAISVAFAHLMFNFTGISILWWVRFIPMKIARFLADLALKNRAFAVVYTAMIFFIIPLTLIILME